MTKLDLLLAEIKTLENSLNHYNPSIESEYSDYWKMKDALSDLLMQAGNFYLTAADQLTAIKFFFASYIGTQKLEMYAKLNLELLAESESSAIPDIVETNVEKLFLYALQALSGIGVPVNYVAALHNLQAAADRGYAPAQYILGDMYLEGKGTPSDSASAVFWLRTAANQNYAAAQVYLGYLCEEGNCVEKDYDLAIVWYRKAAEQGHAGGQRNLGFMYLNGRGVAKDEKQAVVWYRKGAEQGNSHAQNILGLRYQYGQDIEKDYAQALAWYQKAAKQGNDLAENNLGVMYENGYGVARSNSQACDWYRLSAAHGNADAEYNLGRMYQNGRGVAQNDLLAVAWYRKSAAQGNSNAERSLGFMYENGRGVAKDNDNAFAWYRKSAEQGNASAEYHLGSMYENGRGVANDDVQALAWYRKSADQGNADAEFSLGWMYRNGRAGVKDEKQAAIWYRKSAEQANAKAQFDLGCMYEYGVGIAKDDVQAAAWYLRAANQGNTDAATNLGTMYAQGKGVIQNDLQAVAWYRKAAEKGDTTAELNLGLMSVARRGITNDDVQAGVWFRKAAVSGLSSAQYVVGFMYYNGEGGLPVDFTQAFMWQRKAAEQGYDEAKSYLNRLYELDGGPTGPEDAKKYRNDLRLGIQKAKLRLLKCQRENPNDFDCQYHYCINKACDNDPIYSYLDALYQKHPEQVVRTILSDELLNEDSRIVALIHLYDFSVTKKINIIEDLAYQVGNYYFEHLPMPHSRFGLSIQIQFAKMALECFEKITTNSPHYNDAADAIVLMRERFEGKDLQELYEQYFAKKGLQHPHEKVIGDYVESTSNNYRNELQEYCNSPPARTRQHTALVMDILSTEKEMGKLVARLDAIQIKPEDDLYVIHVLRNQDRCNAMVRKQSENLAQFGIWEKSAAKVLGTCTQPNIEYTQNPIEMQNLANRYVRRGIYKP